MSDDEILGEVETLVESPSFFHTEHEWRRKIGEDRDAMQLGIAEMKKRLHSKKPIENRGGWLHAAWQRNLGRKVPVL